MQSTNPHEIYRQNVLDGTWHLRIAMRRWQWLFVSGMSILAVSGLYAFFLSPHILISVFVMSAFLITIDAYKNQRQFDALAIRVARQAYKNTSPEEAASKIKNAPNTVFNPELKHIPFSGASGLICIFCIAFMFITEQYVFSVISMLLTAFAAMSLIDGHSVLIATLKGFSLKQYKAMASKEKE
jgi:hypothetical protein